VLDDLHAVTDSGILNQIEWFLGHVPASECRVVVCSRGVIVAQDPVDRLIPNDERRRTLRLLVDLAASVETLVEPGTTGSPGTTE
jgi:hypothetical protein